MSGNATLGANANAFDRARQALLALRPLRDPQLRKACAALRNNQPHAAQQLLSAFLMKRPNDVDALNLMAEVAMQFGRHGEAETLLAACLERAPDFDAARFGYANALLEQRKYGPALESLDELLTKEPNQVLYRSQKAFVLARMGRYQESMDNYQQLIADVPDVPRIWVDYGYVLRALGFRKECIAAWRKAIEISPWQGAAWWQMASLRTFRFGEADIQAMESQLGRPDLPGEDRVALHYALGKAYDDCDDYARSFQNYAKANAMRRLAVDYNPEATSALVPRCKALFTPAYFRERAGAGCDSKAPIFIIGMQRSGSTLVEQILSSHSAIEAAGEIDEIRRIIEEHVAPMCGENYPLGVNRLGQSDLRALGEKYLELTRRHRPLGRPFFVDKCPSNFWHLGFIHSILPQARIIDARRHPVACCYSNFTMNFREGLPISYRLAELGRHYTDYVRLMAHFDRVMPGKIHRVIYENLVTDFDAEVRRMLDFIGLPYEPACSEFHKNERALESLSSEQVRSPIFTDSLDRWRRYEPWLGSLKSALGPVLERYPDVPDLE
ncbi:MAG TPA: sulfotransferase [Rhizomicrobium sp.]|nr:sulfotransferase [Rhizomicrobium sp.]